MDAGWNIMNPDPFKSVVKGTTKNKNRGDKRTGEIKGKRKV
jgi:hypothetical protein